MDKISQEIYMVEIENLSSKIPDFCLLIQLDGFGKNNKGNQ